MVGLEARRTVAAGARLEDVTPFVVVVHTAEEAQRAVGRDRLREGDGTRRHGERVDVVARQVGLLHVERRGTVILVLAAGGGFEMVAAPRILVGAVDVDVVALVAVVHLAVGVLDRS